MSTDLTSLLRAFLSDHPVMNGRLFPRDLPRKISRLIREEEGGECVGSLFLSKEHPLLAAPIIRVEDELWVLDLTEWEMPEEGEEEGEGITSDEIWLMISPINHEDEIASYLPLFRKGTGWKLPEGGFDSL